MLSDQFHLHPKAEHQQQQNDLECATTTPTTTTTTVNNHDQRRPTPTMPTCFESHLHHHQQQQMQQQQQQQHQQQLHQLQQHQQHQQHQQQHQVVSDSVDHLNAHHLLSSSVSTPGHNAYQSAAAAAAAAAAVASVNGAGIRYYQPLMDPRDYSHLAPRGYTTLANQKRESVITFSSNHAFSGSGNGGAHHLKNVYHHLDSIDLVEEKQPRMSHSPDLVGNSNNNSNNSHPNGKATGSAKQQYKQQQQQSNNQVLIDGIAFTIDQVVCICQVLQKSDLHKLGKFIYTLPLAVDNGSGNTGANGESAGTAPLAKNELILRARAIAAFHSDNFKEVYDLLENNIFSVKYHQELQNLWNNAHYKEHEQKRGHPPGAVEKYRIRKKFQFPRTIWDGEEYVYCFKEKNRRVLKNFYINCNLPTQEDKLKLSSQTQLTVVQISNWFKNRRQRDRQPNHEHDKTSSDAHSNVTNDSCSVTTPSPPILSMTTVNPSATNASTPTTTNSTQPPNVFSALSDSTAALLGGNGSAGGGGQSHLHLLHHHHHHLHNHHNQSLGSNEVSMDQTEQENTFCLLGQSGGGGLSQPPSAHRSSYYFLPQ